MKYISKKSLQRDLEEGPEDEKSKASHKKTCRRVIGAKTLGGMQTR